MARSSPTDRATDGPRDRARGRDRDETEMRDRALRLKGKDRAQNSWWRFTWRTHHRHVPSLE